VEPIPTPLYEKIHRSFLWLPDKWYNSEFGADAKLMGPDIRTAKNVTLFKIFCPEASRGVPEKIPGFRA